MSLYFDQFIGWYQGVDRSTDDVEDPFSVLESVLYPYFMDCEDRHPLSHGLIAKRTRVIDSAILKCMRL